MDEGLERAIDQVFNKEYLKIKPILDNILPQIKKEGWVYKNNITYTDNNSENILSFERLESEINNLYFYYNTKFYEQKIPYLKEIDTFWYGVLKQFFYTWNNISPNRLHNKLLEDYKGIIETE